MLDDSLSTGHLDPPLQTDNPSVTIAESREDLGAGPKRRALEIGARFAGYQIRGYLGQGAMGVVYEAWDPSHERLVSLKLARSPTKRAVDRLLRDSRALARIAHPNIVRIWAADIHRDAIYLVMEMVEGRNLREWLSEPRGWSEVLDVVTRAGRGLAAAHAAGIVHHDVKPENILVDWDGRAQILDFGVARISPEHPEHVTSGAEDQDQQDQDQDLDPASLSGAFANLSAFDLAGVGPHATLRDAIAYMAPEQHEQGADFRSDQFGFCVTLFEAIYGAHPFPATRAQDLIEAASAGRIEFPEGRRAEVPRWVERALVRGLSPRRDERFATMEELLEALDRYPMRRRRRRQASAIAGLGLLAVALGLLVPRAGDRGTCSSFDDELARAALDTDGLATLAARGQQLPDEALGANLDRLSTGLRDWTVRWTEARAAHCEATVDEAHPRELEAAQDRCLTRQLDEVSALSSLIREADPPTLAGLARGAESALLRLPDPARCQTEAPPAGPSDADDELRQLAWLSAVAPGPELETRAEAAFDRHGGDSPSNQRARAEAELALARLGLAEHDAAQAEAHARACVRAAEGLADDSLRAEALVALGRALLDQRGRELEARATLDDAAAVIERVSAPAWLDERQTLALARALAASGASQPARAHLDALLDAARERNHPITSAKIEVELARVELGVGRAREALALAESARATLDAALPDALSDAPPDPRLTRARLLVVRSHLALAELDAAGEVLAELGPLAPETPLGRERLELDTALALARGDDVRAADLLRELLALTPAARAGARAALLDRLARTHQRAGRVELAIADFREARRLLARAEPRDEQLAARVNLGLGLALLAAEPTQAATLVLEDAEQSWPKALADTPEHRALREALTRAREPREPAEAAPGQADAAESDPN